MLIKSIELKNFKQYVDETITFQDGLTGITGQNGAGKSTITQAISFGLFGLKNSGVSSRFIVSTLVPEGAVTSVVLTFEINNDTYKIERKYQRTTATSKHTCNIYCNDELITTGVQESNAHIYSLLGMSGIDFRNTVYATQNDLKILLNEDPATRKRWFMSMLGIDYIQAYTSTKIKEEEKQLTEEMNKTNGLLLGINAPTLSANYNNVKNTIQSLTQTKDMLSKKLASEETLLERLDTTYNNLSKIKWELTRDMETFDKLNASKITICTKIAQIQESLDLTKQTLERFSHSTDVIDPDSIMNKYKTLSDRMAYLRDAQLSLIRYEATIDKHSDLIATKNNMLEEAKANLETHLEASNTYRDQIAKMVLDFPDMKGQISQKQLDIDDINIAYAKLKEQYVKEQYILSNLQEQIAKFTKLGEQSICPTCQQPLGENFQNIIQTLERDYTETDNLCKKTKSELYKIEAQLKDETNTYNKLVAIYRDYQDLNSKLTGNADTISLTSNHIETLTAEISGLIDSKAKTSIERNHLLNSIKLTDDLDATIAHLTEQCSIYTSTIIPMISKHDGLINKLNNLKTEKTSVMEEIAKLTQKISEYPDIDKQLASAKTNIDNQNDTVKYVRQTLIETDSSILFNKTELTRIEEAIKTRDKLIIKQQELEFDMECNMVLKTNMKTFITTLLDVMKTNIETESSNIIDQITAGKYNTLMLDDNYNILIMGNDGNYYPVDRYSGGEQDVFALALRIALCKYIGTLNNINISSFVILDEIFGSQDTERQTLMTKTLRSLEKTFPQIFMISHIEAVKDGFDNILFVTQDTDLCSHVEYR